jgi:HSP20 family protein
MELSALGSTGCGDASAHDVKPNGTGEGGVMALPVRQSPPSGSLAERPGPFRDIDELQTRLDQLIGSVLRGNGDGLGDGVWVPRVDIEEAEDAWVFEAEVPGVKRDDVNVELRDSELVISGDIKERERTGILRRRTRRTGEFEYRVVLPYEADSNRVEASLDGGVLKVRIPKPERDSARKIEVK